jgi:hypothetical protein
MKERTVNATMYKINATTQKKINKLKTNKN